jgi:hypothetical protein
VLGVRGVVDQDDVGPASGQHAAGGGLAFVYLPKAAGIPVGREMPEPPGEELAKGSETVLLVEDDQGVLDRDRDREPSQSERKRRPHCSRDRSRLFGRLPSCVPAHQ